MYNWDNIIQNNKLIKLPRIPNCETIMFTFLKQGKFSIKRLNKFKEITEGLLMYFNKALPECLLYAIERQQYNQLIQMFGTKYQLTQLYGAEHLLRCFIQLPDILNSIKLIPIEQNTLRIYINSVLKFLAKNQEYYLCQFVEHTSASIEVN